MDKNEIIERLERLARCATHTIGELPFVMSLDDGIAVHEAIDLIKEAKPTADVAPIQHGRWGCDMGGVWCSVCGEYSKGEWDYCPYCGARMVGVEEQCE